MKPQIARLTNIHLLLPTTQNWNMCVTRLVKSSPPSWFIRSSCQDSTTATLSWQVLPSQRLTLYNAYKTQLRVSYLGSERVTMWPRPASTALAASTCLILGIWACDHATPALRQLYRFATFWKESMELLTTILIELSLVEFLFQKISV